MVLKIGLPSHVVDRERMPPLYPTHRHPPAFWEALGRTVATYGHLEEVIARAIYAITGTRTVEIQNIEKEYNDFLEKIKKIIKYSLGSLVDELNRILQNDNRFCSEQYENLIFKLKNSVEIRHVLCHGSWGSPDEMGASKPFFVDNNHRIFETRVDVSFLDQVQREVAQLSFDVRDLVTSKGVQFPGTPSIETRNQCGSPGQAR